MERGQLGTVPLQKLRRVAAVLEVRLLLEPRWRGAAIDRVRGHRHSTMADAITRLLTDARWFVRPEVSFEFKTELADVNRLLGTTECAGVSPRRSPSRLAGRR